MPFDDDRKFKPINIFGYIISTFGMVCGVMATTIFFADDEFSQPTWFIVLGVIQVLTFLIGGVGVIMRKPWAYYVLKLILYWFLIAFPIGTLISVKMLNYIKKNNIKDFFIA
jgi:hypothetical protein